MCTAKSTLFASLKSTQNGSQNTLLPEPHGHYINERAEVSSFASQVLTEWLLVPLRTPPRNCGIWPVPSRTLLAVVMMMSRDPARVLSPNNTVVNAC